MKLYVCAVRDRAVDAFGVPFFCKAVGEAARSFDDEVNRAESVFYSHPDDYDLYLLGTYDDATGAMDCNSPSMLSVGKSVSRKTIV